MKKIIFYTMAIIIMGLSFDSCVSTSKIRTENGISEMRYLEINNTKQHLLIRGKDVKNPVLLFLHGGPGASATALMRKYNSVLENDFTIVYWDQRNAGKSYDKKLPKEEIQVNKYLKDIDSLTDYLKGRFKVKKIFLVGHSWGARLGMYAIKRHPENYMAYIGIGQEVAAYQAELLSYRYTLKKAQEAKNTKAIEELKEIGEPQSGDYRQMYKTGFWGLVKQKEWLLKLGGERYDRTNYRDWMFSIWFSREYSFFDVIKYGKASGFSAGNIINDPDFNNFNFLNQIPKVEVPVFFISGKYDYNTPWTLVKKYHDRLNAPYKEFIVFDKSGHSPIFEEPERFNKEIIRIFAIVNSRQNQIKKLTNE
ncbi:alpha/beta hydrolase [uncultured Croceitalea sp.]|uniref:alpha/beta fold hydrolase n=1 Tax=uncultured Croceitalea sp. TaxID=1798908 RepID=UPI0033063892